MAGALDRNRGVDHRGAIHIEANRRRLSAAPPNAGQPLGTKMRILRALPAGIEVDDALSISEQVEL
jgi:hypothetical protein